MSVSLVRTVVVDDQDDVRQLLRLRLERSGSFEVVGEGTDGHQAVALCAEHRPHLVIVDAAMPGMNGLEAVPGIRDAAPDTAIIVYTAESGLATRNEAERLGAHAVVGKGDPFEQLVDTVFRLVPECAPPRQARPGTDRLEALLAHEPPARTGRPASSAPARSSRTFVLLAVLVLLPGLAFVAWVVAALSGLLVQ